MDPHAMIIYFLGALSLCNNAQMAGNRMLLCDPAPRYTSQAEPPVRRRIHKTVACGIGNEKSASVDLTEITWPYNSHPAEPETPVAREVLLWEVRAVA
jgi:hypothetical protein